MTNKFRCKCRTGYLIRYDSGSWLRKDKTSVTLSIGDAAQFASVADAGRAACIVGASCYTIYNLSVPYFARLVKAA